jgi:cobalamin biosynthesis protein CobD/CbiB
VLAIGSVSVVAALIFAAASLANPLAWIVHGLLLYSLLALGDLVHHVWGVERGLANAGLRPDVPPSRISSAATSTAWMRGHAGGRRSKA